MYGAETVRTAIALAALWGFVCWLYRDYRDDVLKQNLFGLRDELFDLALKGRLEFNQRAYGMSRSAINGILFSAEQFSVFGILMHMLFGRGPEIHRLEEERKARWSEALDELDPETRAAVEGIRQRMYFKMVDHLVFTSPILWLLVVPVLAGVVVAAVGGAVQQAVRTKLVELTGLEDLDLVALGEDCDIRAAA